MKGIQCFSSRPIQTGRDISGYAKYAKDYIDLPDYMLLTLCLSALQWRKTNGEITLHTDTLFYNYLSEKKVTSFWNNIVCSLDNISDKFPGINHAVFWSAGKFYCYLIESAPFVCVDTDLIVWKKLNFNPNHDLMFTHWESIETEDTSYIDQSGIQVSNAYNFIDVNTKITKGLNMSITALLNEEFKNLFTKKATEFMLSSTKNYDGSYATPEILYMEQVLPVQIALKYGFNISPFIQCTWSPKQFRFISQDKKLGDWIFNSFNENHICTHLWFHKNYIDKNNEARKEYLDSIIYVFKKNFPEEYDMINF